VIDASYAPLTVHWSTEEGRLSEFYVGLCGAVASVIGLRERWRACA